MPNINPVDLQTLGARVTDPAQLTKGRWYAVRVNCSGTHNPLVHAKYIGHSGPVNAFSVAEDDYNALKRSLGLAKLIHREDSSIRTGKIDGGGVCEIFRFKQVKSAPVSPTGRMRASAPAIQNLPKSAGVRPVVKEVSPYEDSKYATCTRYGIKVGDKFRVINAVCHPHIAVGDIVTLRDDDGSSWPYFTHEATGKEVIICLHRLVPVVANQSNTSAPAVALSTVDQIKSEIDALRAKVQQKRDQITKLSEEIAGFTQAIEDTREKLRANLEGYI